ncbi:MAG: hypothetical protein WC974_07270 [Thermoplasmata archaeon]
MIIEEMAFESLLAMCASPMATPIHKHNDVFYLLAHIGESVYIAIARDAPKGVGRYIEYDVKERWYKIVEPSKDSFSRNPTVVTIPIVEVKKLHGEMGGKIKKVLEGK